MQQTKSFKTTTPLGGAGTWNPGPVGGTRCGTYARITAIVWADQAGNFFIDQSGDGINWDQSTITAITASTGAAVSVEVVGDYFRPRFVNGATPQGALRVFVFLRGV